MTSTSSLKRPPLQMGPIRRNYPWALPLLAFVLTPSIAVWITPWAFGEHVGRASGLWFLGVYSPLAPGGWYHEQTHTSLGLFATASMLDFAALAIDLVAVCLDYVSGRRFGRIVDTILYPVAWYFSVTDYYSYGKIAGPPRDGEGYVPRTPEEIAASDRSVNRVYAFCFRVAATIIGLFFVYTGLFGLNRYIRYPKPIATTVADFTRVHPTAGWYRLEDAKVDYSFPYLERDPGMRGYALYPVVSSRGGRHPVSVFIENRTSDSPSEDAIGPFDCMVTKAIESPESMTKDLAGLPLAKPLRFVEPGGPYPLRISLPCLIGGLLAVYLFGIWPILSSVKKLFGRSRRHLDPLDRAKTLTPGAR